MSHRAESPSASVATALLLVRALESRVDRAAASSAPVEGASRGVKVGQTPTTLDDERLRSPTAMRVCGTRQSVDPHGYVVSSASSFGASSPGNCPENVWGL